MVESVAFGQLAFCVSFVEDQVESFDDRNETSLAEEHGQAIQRAFLILVVSQLEHGLKKLCEVLAEVRNLKISQRDLKGSAGFDTCLAYLEKVLQVHISDSECRRVRGIVGIRNALVHEGGFVSGRSAEIDRLSRYLKINAEGQIRLNGPFVQEACESCRAFLEGVVKAVCANHEPWRSTRLRRKK